MVVAPPVLTSKLGVNFNNVAALFNKASASSRTSRIVVPDVIAGTAEVPSPILVGYWVNHPELFWFLTTYWRSFVLSEDEALPAFPREVTAVPDLHRAVYRFDRDGIGYRTPAGKWRAQFRFKPTDFFNVGDLDDDEDYYFIVE